VRSIRFRAAAVLAAAVVSTTADLLADRDADQAQFRADVDLVTLDACVRDPAGRVVAGLTADDFVVVENGVRQRVELFHAADDLPLNVVLLIDRSASMHGGKLDRARQAAAQFAASLRPADRLEIIAFNERATIVRAAEAATARLPLPALTATGATALYDAMMLAAHQLSRSRRIRPVPQVRDVVIVLSDGEDTASVMGFDEVLPVMRRSGALVYGLSLRAGRHGDTLGATWPLQQLARDTGASAIAVPQLESLAALYAEIDREVRTLYRLAYVSTNGHADGEWRTITVRVTNPQMRVRTRSGYYAARALR
jgi:Ca-activated chloride channel family protein